MFTYVVVVVVVVVVVFVAVVVFLRDESAPVVVRPFASAFAATTELGGPPPLGKRPRPRPGQRPGSCPQRPGQRPGSSPQRFSQLPDHCRHPPGAASSGCPRSHSPSGPALSF